jgi:SOS regulatory protein LexA
MEKKDDLAQIESFYEKHRRMPSYSEIAEIYGFASKFSAHKKVQNFLDQGLLSKDSKGKLLPKHISSLSKKKVHILGSVEAGFGSPYEETANGKTTLDDYMIPHKNSTFMMRVAGDSMCDAGILDNDMLLVEKVSTANINSIVIAEIDGAYTVKYLRKDKKGFYLAPANDEFPDLRPEGKLIIVARVIGTLRKYD